MRRTIVALALAVSLLSACSPSNAAQPQQHRSISTQQLVRKMRIEERQCSSKLSGAAYYADRHCSAFDRSAVALEKRGLCMMDDELFIDCDYGRPYREDH